MRADVLYSQLTRDAPDLYVTEASTLGLPPGAAPTELVFEDGVSAAIAHTEVRDGDVQWWDMVGPFIKVRVFND